jgi:hypothetical protein
MLHEGETSKEQAEMLEMGTSDHEEDQKAEPPMPVDAEEEVDPCAPSCTGSCQVCSTYGTDVGGGDVGGGDQGGRRR